MSGEVWPVVAGGAIAISLGVSSAWPSVLNEIKDSVRDYERSRNRHARDATSRVYDGRKFWGAIIWFMGVLGFVLPVLVLAMSMAKMSLSEYTFIPSEAMVGLEIAFACLELPLAFLWALNLTIARRYLRRFKEVDAQPPTSFFDEDRLVFGGSDVTPPLDAESAGGEANGGDDADSEPVPDREQDSGSTNDAATRHNPAPGDDKT